jgi:hypothetical protein
MDNSDPRKPLIVVRSSPEIPVKALRENWSSKVVFMFNPLSAAFNPSEAEAAVTMGDVSLSGCLDSVVNRKENPELHSFLGSTLAATDYKAAIDAKIKEYMPAGIPGSQVS